MHRLPLFAALLLLAFASPMPVAASFGAPAIDLRACDSESADAGALWCVGGPGCTSTSRCTGAEAGTEGSRQFCIDGICTPMIPSCVRVKAWWTDYEDSPTVDTGDVC